VPPFAGSGSEKSGTAVPSSSIVEGVRTTVVPEFGFECAG